MEEFFRDKMFGDLKIPFSAVSVDLESGEEYVLKEED
jgi:predicted acylesterase/phospholipase RssA